MAHNRPWYKRSGADFVMGCLDLPDGDHKWAYSAIVDMLNDRDRPLPDDAGFICGFTGLSRKKWSVVRARLLDSGKLVLVDGGYISNPRFERERAERLAEHERAVEFGRIGGRASAEKRAAQQHEMDLSEQGRGDYRANYPADKRPDSPLDSPETRTQKPQKSAILNEPPPQQRARAKRPRDIESTTNERKKQPPARARAHAREEAPARGGVSGGLDALTWAAVDAAGLTARCRGRPGLFQQSREIVNNWQQAGVDVQRLAIPLIGKLVQSADEPAHSLAKFTAAIETAHVRQRGKTRARTAPPPEPVFQFADESPSFTAFRQAIHDRLPDDYPRWCDKVRFARMDLKQDGDQQLVRVEARGTQTWTARDVVDRHGPLLRGLASDVLGATNLW